jgi:hypothetical protein
VAIPEMIQGGVFSKSAIDRLLQFVNGAMNRVVHAALLMRHDDRLAAIKARLDHAAFVVMAGLITNRVAEVYSDPPDAIAVPVQRCTQLSLHTIRKLLAAVDVSVCPDLDQHHRLRCFMACTAVRLFYAVSVEEALFHRVAVWPCSAGFASAFLNCSLDGISEWSPGPFWLRFAGGTAGTWPCFDIDTSLTVVAH